MSLSIPKKILPTLIHINIQSLDNSSIQFHTLMQRKLIEILNRSVTEAELGAEISV